MAYEPTVWKTGDIVSSERLNKIEEGIANAGGGSFDLSDRMAKGEGEGAVVEGKIEDSESFGYVVHKNEASGRYSHAEGSQTTASGNNSHTEGSSTKATSVNSHAEGSRTTASGSNSHAEGSDTTAIAGGSHAEGLNTTASGDHSHAEGSDTTAIGYSSHAEGSGTIAKGICQHVFGCGNIEDPFNGSSDAKSTYLEIVGNGTDKGMGQYDRSNARTLDWSGNEKLAGSLTLGMGTSDEITITPAQLKALIAMIPIS